MHHPPPPNRRLSLVAAAAENGCIGRDSGLPWKLPDEMQQFRALTLGHAVIMGRRNFMAEGKPLPHRRNLVLTRQMDWHPPAPMSGGPRTPPPENTPEHTPKNTPEQTARDEIEIFHDLAAALHAVSSDPEPFIIGGAEIYKLALPRVDRMYLTTVHATLEGDTFFPTWNPDQWQLTDQRHHGVDARHAYAFTVNTYDRIRSTQ